MVRRVPRATVLVLVATVSVAVLPFSPATSAKAKAGCGLPTGVIEVHELPRGLNATKCDAVGRRVRSEEGLTVEVPPPGAGVTSEALFEDGAALLEIETSDEGIVTTSVSGDAASVPTSATGGPSACSDDTYVLKGYKRDSALEWSWGDGPNPSAATDDQVVATLKAAAAAMETANDCGYSDQVSADATFAGLTTRESEIDNDDGESSCEAYVNADGFSVIDAGNLDNNGNPPISMACVWSYSTTGPNTIRAVDIRFNTTDYSFTRSPGSADCAGRYYDLQAIATHEFGHAFGLGHVAENTHGNLTMSSGFDPCDASARTLGQGDILGLREYY